MATIEFDQTDMTVEELAARVGAVPLWRIRTDPPPGLATEDDVERLRIKEDLLCELLGGVLVEKASSDVASCLAALLGALLGNFVRPGRLGWIMGPNGFVWLSRSRLRAPDVSFVRRDQRSRGKLLTKGYADVAPALAAEIYSPGNTAREMEQRRKDYFEAGTESFWIVYPQRREIEVSTGPGAPQILGLEDTLTGDPVLRGFSLPVKELFAAVELKDDSSE